MTRPAASVVLVFLLACSGCARIVEWMDEGAPAAKGAPAAPKPKKTKRKRKPRPIVKAVPVDAKNATITGQPPRGAEQLLDVLSALRTELSVGEIRYLSSRLTRRTLAGYGSRRDRPSVPPIAPPVLRRRIAGKVRAIRYDGGRAVVQLEQRAKTAWLWFFLEDGYWRLDLADDRSFQEAAQVADAPKGTRITLKEATAGIRGTGPLVAVIKTTVGVIRCRLHTAQAPRTTAHFIGLARGLIPTSDRSAVPPVWRRKAVYDGTRFHRLLDGVAIIGGRIDGEGGGVAIADEFTAALRHDRPGVLSLANRGANTGGAQFFITLAAAPDFDDRYSVFGRCRDREIIAAVAQKRAGAVTIQNVVVQRGF